MHDFIIVGGGSSGCALAGRLAMEGGGKSLVLEAGGPDRHPLIHIPAGFTRLLDSRFLYHYETAPQAALDGKTRIMPQGNVLGGGGSVNATIYVRGQRSDYDGWAEAGATGWSYAEVLPYFRRAEDNDRLADEYHGVGGPLGVSDLRQITDITRAFVRSCQEMGISYNADINGARQNGVCYNQTTTRNVRRCSAAVGYLHPARKKGLVDVQTGCHVTRVIFEGDRAVGVEYVQGGKLKAARAAQEVVLSAGAVQTPKLLMLSGIGPEEELRRHGVELRVKSEEVGENLKDHLEYPAVRYCTGKYGYYGEDSPLNTIKNGLQYLLTKTGPVASNVTEACCFVNTDDPAADPNVQMHFVPIVFLDLGTEQIKRAGATINPCVIKPRSKGRLTLISADPKDHPIMDPAYLSDPEDLRLSVAGLEIAREILAQSSFAKYLEPREAFPGAAMTGRAELEAYVKARGKTVYHPVGTCRMGSDDGAVVDAELRVNGVRGLRVVDNSVMPDIVSGNTNAAAIMIGEKAADMLRGAPPLPAAVT